MFKLYFLIIFSFLVNLTIPSIFAEKNEENFESISTTKLNWQPILTDFENHLIWYELDEKEIYKEQIKIKTIAQKNKVFSVRSLGKAVNVNGFNYPDISNYVPNAYVEDPNKTFGLSTRGISKTRYCNGKNFSSACMDGALDIDFKLFNNNEVSIYPKVNIQSLTNRGTDFGNGISLGLKIAKDITPNWSLALGGENIIHFDKSIDLGHNYYLIASTYLPLDSTSKSKILFLNAGLGSDFYGYRGNGFLFRTPCGNNSLTGTVDDPNSCTWGPIGSVALAFNDRFSVISEWFGYSYGTGFSIRPFEGNSLTISFLATDFISGFPKYAEDFCQASSCTTRFYGSIGLNF